MGPNGNTNFAAQRPSLAYNPQALEYLVVWDGDDTTAPLVDNETEVYGQRLIATGRGRHERLPHLGRRAGR